MLNPTLHNPPCPKCESSLKKITLSHQAFCPHCFTSFFEYFSQSINIKISCDPKQIRNAIKSENYELAESLTRDLKIPSQEHPFLFTRVEFFRNLNSYKFLNSENDKLEPAILSDLKLNNPELKEIKDLSNNTILSSEDTYIKVLNKHHISYGYINTASNTRKIEEARQENQTRDIKNNFAYHEKMGFLGPNPSQLGDAFKLQFGIALPHLYMDNQIPRISKACSDLGFTLKPMQTKKNSPLIYILENKSSSNTNLKKTISKAIQLGQSIKIAEEHAQLKALQSDDQQCFKLFASAFWALGSLPSITPEEYFSYLEDMMCASLFNYLDKHQPQELTQLFQSQLPPILLSNDAHNDCDTSKVMNKDFEYFLNTLRS